MLSFQGKFKKKFKKRKSKPAPERVQLPWSEYQRQIFNNIADNDGHTVVLSGPGSGKTQTIVEGLYHVPEQYRSNNRTLFTAFNRSIAKELEKRVPSGVMSATHHALGYRCIRKHWGALYDLNAYGSVDSRNDSLFELANEQIGDDINHNRLRQMLVKALDLSKIVLANSPENIQDVLDEYGIPLCNLNEEEFALHVFQMMEKTRNQPRILNGRNVITFSDMIWLPYINGWKLDQFERVFIDEAQDLSPARTELLLASLAPGGRVLACGDTNQAIYNFAGASPRSLEGLIKTLNAKQLPLSVSYRCARVIIEMAKKINPMIEAAPNAEDGEIETFDGEYLYEVVEPGCAVLSRTNFPLVRACFGMLALGLNTNIQGKDIGDRLLWRIKTWEPDSIPALIKSAREWADELCERLNEKKRDTTSITDEAKCIEMFAENADNIDEVQERIQQFFSDEDAQIKLSTGHKSKGLEWNKVFLLDKTYHPERGGEEENIWYVSITRAKSFLGLVEGKLP